MRYSTLQEYFYKFQSVLYLLVLLPLLAFIVPFVFDIGGTFGITNQPSLLSEFLTGVVVVDWLFTFLIFMRISKIKSLVGLGLKLERYYTLTTVRFSMLSLAGLILVMGFFLKGAIIFPILFFINLFLFFLLWPRPSKVCRDLKLKGDEWEMVYYKRMNL